ncbi:MAG TPA: CDP-glycerol glycerophosphotransferase family protein [Glaciihabitans sp.]|nr:CDP-glycerol glycerophosphotransferase family protein [Glaciihabitans sp.]
MKLVKELSTARRVAGNILKSRTNRRAVARQLRTREQPAPRSIDVAVYFADPAVNMYQLRQWYAPLAELSKTWPVAIISRSPSATLKLWDEAPIPTLYLRSVPSLEQFVEEQQPRIILYVNQNSKNFQMFRYGRMWHVFINHGESDKMYMTTNQFKAYDYSLIAGDAARERLGRTLWNYDLDERTISIGRPQADHFAGQLPYTPDERQVVLYAPTWEGDRPAAAYGSIISHGGALVDAVLASGTHRLIYRPHPRSGVANSAYARANQAIIAAIAKANAQDPTAQHVYDDGAELGWQLAAADVAITDISAMVYDRLATGRPLLVTRPVSAQADIDASGYLGNAEWLDASVAGDIIAIADRVQHSEDAKQSLNWWVERYFGDTTPGASTARFHAAIRRLMDEWAKNAAK